MSDSWKTRGPRKPEPRTRAGMSLLRHGRSIDSMSFWDRGEPANPAPRPIVSMSLQPAIPRRVALQQSSSTLRRLEPLCNDRVSSVERFSADGACLTRSVSQKGPQSTIILSGLQARNLSAADERRSTLIGYRCSTTSDTGPPRSSMRMCRPLRCCTTVSGASKRTASMRSTVAWGPIAARGSRLSLYF
jgi:hypothetical protein